MRDLSRRGLLLGASCSLLPLVPGPCPAGGSPVAAPVPSLPVPRGEVVLTVSGAIPWHNAPEGAQFDRAMLEDLGMHQFRTGTPWSEQAQSFRGPLLHSLTTALGLNTGTFVARALNDYSIPVPVSDAVPRGPILAMEVDGVTLSLRGRGPIWLIYPFDQVPAYRREIHYIRSIWQLTHLEWQDVAPPAGGAG